MGERLANIALILHEYERKVLGDKKLKEEDDAQKNSDHTWYEKIEFDPHEQHHWSSDSWYITYYNPKSIIQWYNFKFRNE